MLFKVIQSLLCLQIVFLDTMLPSSIIINPRRACARVTVLVLSVCLCVCCVSVCFPYSGTSRNQAYKQQYQRLQRDTGMKYKKGFFFKTFRSEVMASFTHLEQLRRRFRDPSAVLSTKLGSTLLRKPIATVSLHRQRTSRRQRASHLHRLVNGDVYGSRILIATHTSLSHVRAIY